MHLRCPVYYENTNKDRKVRLVLLLILFMSLHVFITRSSQACEYRTPNTPGCKREDASNIRI